MIGKEAKNVQVLAFSYSQTLLFISTNHQITYTLPYKKIASESVHKSIIRHWAEFEMIDVKDICY